MPVAVAVSSQLAYLGRRRRKIQNLSSAEFLVIWSPYAFGPQYSVPADIGTHPIYAPKLS